MMLVTEENTVLPTVVLTGVWCKHHLTVTVFLAPNWCLCYYWGSSEKQPACVLAEFDPIRSSSCVAPTWSWHGSGHPSTPGSGQEGSQWEGPGQLSFHMTPLCSEALFIPWIAVSKHISLMGTPNLIGPNFISWSSSTTAPFQTSLPPSHLGAQLLMCFCKPETGELSVKLTFPSFHMTKSKQFFS